MVDTRRMSLGGLIVILVSACSLISPDMGSGDDVLSNEVRLEYLDKETPPCVAIPGSSTDPCAVRKSPDLSSDAFTPVYRDIPAYWDLYYDPEDLLSIFAPHLVIRATFLPNTTRCASFKDELPVFTDISLASIEYLVTCFVDAQVNDYVIGTGPPMLSVAAHVYPFLYVEGASLEWIERHRVMTAEAFEGREGVLFLSPSSTTVVEAWWMTEFWDVQESGDTVTVVAPFKESIERNNRGRFTPEDLALLERPLSEFERVISEGAVARATETGGRIGIGDDLPMLITDANLLRPYYEGPGVGVDYESDPPEVPPPVPGGDGPVQPPITTGEEEDGSSDTVPIPGEDNESGDGGGGTVP